MQKPCQSFGNGLTDFAGYKNVPFFFILKDAADGNLPAGYKENNAIGIFTRTGKVIVNSSKYMELVAAFKPTGYELLCDGETNSESSKKRTMKAVDRTENFFEECLKLEKSGGVRIASVEGGYIKEERQRMLGFL